LKDILEKDFGTTNIDSLVNNAGTGYYASIEDTTEEGFDEMATTHLKAPFFLTQKLLPFINEGGFLYIPINKGVIDNKVVIVK
jgi:NAD(P)-dependent dehydrogenase (short-subunit alcohol dehydrogenase family)